MRDGYLLVKAAAETGRAELGPKHPVALQAQVQFAFAQWVSVFNTQESADAEQTLVDLIQDLESVLGDDHSFVLRVRHQHGRILLINGLYTRGYGDLVARGEAVLNQARDGYLRIFGSANPLTRTVDVDLSQAQARRSGTGASTEALRGAYDRLKDLYPPEHEEVVRAGSLLAAALLQDGQIEVGERLMRDALEQIEGLAGPLGTSVTPLRLVLAKALIDAGRVDAGLDEANALLALVRPGFERGEMMAFGLWKSVADLYVAAGRDEDALVLFQEAAELALDHLEPTSQRRAVTLSAHAHALSLGDQPGSALAVIDPAIATATVVTMDSAAIQDGEEVWNPTAAPTMHLVRVEALLLLERDEDAQAAFTTLLETHARPRALLWVVQATVALNSPDLIKTFGDALLAAALTARDELEPDGNADLVWRDAVIAKLHSARGDFAFAVQWQAQAVEAADADHLNDAKRTLEAYRAALEAANESMSGP
jgi:tetratricopeptide (TPR) repeat protein